MERGEGQERPAVIASYLQTRSNEGLPDDSDYVLVVRMEHTAHSKTCNSTKYMDVVVARSGLSKAVFAGWPFLKSPCRPPLSRTRVFAATLVEKNHPILLKCRALLQHCVLEMHPHLAGLSTVLVHMLKKLGCGA
jgi:hypothetical protein